MAKLQFVAGNQLQLLHCGREFFAALLHEIQAAEREIFLETYIFSDDAVANQVRNALCDAAQRGVAVHVIIDWVGSGDARANALAEKFSSAGVACRRFNPWFKRGLARNHRKLAVFDAKRVLIGGINIIDDFLADDGSGARLPFPRWDFAVQLEGALVAQVHREIEAQWLRIGRLGLSARLSLGWRLRLPAPQMNTGPMHAAFVIRDNLRNRATIQRAYMQALGTAKKQAILANPYFAPGRKFRQALISAASRGVDVTLLVGVGEFHLQDAVTRSFYPKLLSHDVKIVEYRKTQLHAKVAVIDDDWATVGSSNVDGLSLFLNHEANIVIRNPEFSASLRGHLETGVQDGVTIALADYINRSWFERFWHGCAYVIYRTAMRIVTWGGYT